MVFLKGLVLALVVTPVLAGESVNINRADAVQIASALEGIGQKKAEKIVVWRNQHGAFHRLDEVANIPGIGNKLAQRNAAWISFGELGKQKDTASRSYQEGQKNSTENLVVPVRAYAP